VATWPSRSTGPTFLVNTSTWRIEGTALDAATGYVLGIAYSPNGRELAEGTESDQTDLWDLSSATPVLAELGQDSDRVTDVAFSPDGLRLLSASSDGTVSLWNLDAAARARRARAMAGRNLTPKEWHQYFGTQPYERICPEFP
jgi:WD40 repeat protein